MTTNPKKMKINPYLSNTNNSLNCDICGSRNIGETNEGYVCRDCGIVLEIQRLEYHLPYNEKKIQNAPLGPTQIGFKRERMRSPKVLQLTRLNKLNCLKENKERIIEVAQKEINRIIEILKLNFTIEMKKKILDITIKIRKRLGKGTKYRNVEKLIPIILYVYCKLYHISINYKELLEVSKIEKREFFSFLKQINSFLPKYNLRNRKEYISQKMLEITEHFNLEMDFYYQSKKILNELWNLINCTKDDVIAGVVCSITVLCNYKNEIKVKNICDKLDVEMSTIQGQIKKNVFEKMNISGFTSLVRSADLLKKAMEQLGIIISDKEKNSDLKFKEKSKESKKIEFIEVKRVINAKNRDKDYLLFFKTSHNKIIVINLEKHGKKIRNQKSILNFPIKLFLYKDFNGDPINKGKGHPI